MSDIKSKAEKRVDEKINFYRKLYIYVTVNVFLFIINLLFSPDYWWFLWVGLLWGIGVVIDYLKTFVFYKKFTEDYRQRKIQEEIEKIQSG